MDGYGTYHVKLSRSCKVRKTNTTYSVSYVDISFKIYGYILIYMDICMGIDHETQKRTIEREKMLGKATVVFGGGGKIGHIRHKNKRLPGIKG